MAPVSREAFHRERKEQHAAEHETVARHFAAFKETAGVAFEIASRVAPISETALQALPPGKPVIRRPPRGQGPGGDPEG